MNLDKAYCASYCVNYDCKRMLSYSVVRAAERQDKELTILDLSRECDDYKAPEGSD